jgi:2-succinyl-6-hydroxy-2,4-cyclohexadiene-1-carboxylate synthase
MGYRGDAGGLMSLSATGYGDPGRPALVFLHGFLGAQDDWAEVIGLIGEEHYCLAYDLPGHGASMVDEEAAYTVPGCAALIAADLQRRALVTPQVVGYSMGGRVALALALDYPAVAERFVMESASPGLLDASTAAARRERDARWAARWLSEPIDAVLRDWYAQRVFEGIDADAARYERMLQRRRRNRPEALARSVEGMSVGRQTPLWDRLPDLQRPVLVLAGERDRSYCVVAEQMAVRSPMVQTALVAEAGHNAHVEQPERFVRTLRQAGVLKGAE